MKWFMFLLFVGGLNTFFKIWKINTCILTYNIPNDFKKPLKVMGFRILHYIITKLSLKSQTVHLVHCRAAAAGS